MARERKLFLLHLSFDTARDGSDVDSQLGRLETLLNDGWDILHSIPMGAAGGTTGVQAGAGAPVEQVTFARWTALVVLQKAEQA